MYIIDLSPFVLLSILFLTGGALIPAAGTYFAFAFITNFSGAIADIWLMSQLIKFHRFDGLIVVDKKTGIALYSSNPQARRLADRLNKQAAKQSRFFTYWVWGSLGFFVFTVLADIVGPFITKRLTIGPSWFPLVSYNIDRHGGSWDINLLNPVIEGFVFAILVKMVSRLLK